MTLKELLERECRYYGAINYEGSVDDAVTLMTCCRSISTK